MSVGVIVITADYHGPTATATTCITDDPLKPVSLSCIARSTAKAVISLVEMLAKKGYAGRAFSVQGTPLRGVVPAPKARKGTRAKAKGRAA